MISSRSTSADGRYTDALNVRWLEFNLIMEKTYMIARISLGTYLVLVAASAVTTVPFMILAIVAFVAGVAVLAGK